MKQKICYIMSFVEFSQQFIDLDEAMDTDKYEISYILLAPQETALQKYLTEKGRLTRFIKYRSKKDLPSATIQIFKLLGKIKPDIVHTHLIDASLSGLAAAKLRNIRKTVHTRHHSVENHIYHPHAVHYDYIINRMSKKIIAITKMVSQVLINQENIHPNKVIIIEHGFNFDNYSFSLEKVAQMKEKYGLTGNFPIIGAISRFVHWKGVQYIIPAFKKLTEKHPQAKLVLANARGDYSEEIKQILRKNLDVSQYVLIEFEKNFIELYKMFDIFVHVPINPESEAFGQTYVESLALEIPSVFTLSGIAADFIIDRRNALIVPYENAEAISEALELLLENDKLRHELTLQAKSDVYKRFNISRMVEQLDSLYQSF